MTLVEKQKEVERDFNIHLEDIQSSLTQSSILGYDEMVRNHGVVPLAKMSEYVAWEKTYIMIR